MFSAMIRRFSVVGGVLLLSACSESAPTAPTPPPPPVFGVVDQPSFVDRSGLQNISGQWVGQYTVGGCSESGSATGTGACASIGRGGGLVLTPVQNGHALSGMLGLGGFTIAVTGSLSNDLIASLAGSGTIAPNVTLTLNTWRGVVAQQSMTGSMAFTMLQGPPTVGTVSVTASLTLAKE